MRSINTTDHPGTAFQKAYGHLREVSDKDPAWFDMARALMKKVDSGEFILMGALIEGLKTAHAMGLKNEYPKQDPEMVKYRTADQAPPKRVTRTPR